MNVAKDLEPLLFPVADLHELPGNPRRGDVDAVKRSYEAFGQRKPIVARRDDDGQAVVVAGNHQLKAVRELGWDRVAVVWADDLSEDEARGFALADNRVADLGSYDDADLLALLDNVTDPALLAATGYTDDDLELLRAAVAPALEGMTDPDHVPDVPPAKTVRGDVWLLGPHRVMCGDSTVPTDVKRLMAGTRPDVIFTDPPYGMNLDADYSSIGGKAHQQVIGDDRPFDATPFMFEFADVDEQFWWGADYYRRTISEGGSWIVWDKHNGNGGGQYDELFGSSFELCWSKNQHRRKMERHTWATSHGRTESDGGFLHPTQKPVALISAMLEKYASGRDLVLDLFGGSGSTLIAAHQLGRVAYLMELDERYCDITCGRFQQATGIHPINEATGNEHDFLTANG